MPVPVAVPGELHIGGAGLARGYLNCPELTAERFIPHPFSDKPGARLYKTGDLVRYLSSGDIEFLGRMDQQVKIRGFRIELGEIEKVLSEHPEVFQSVVVAREEDPGDKQLVAYVVATAGATITGRELRAFLKERLPEYMAPSFFTFLEALPLSPNGKVDRKALPAPAQIRSEETFSAPRTPIEKSLARIWADVLNLDEVGIHDNFFELGGHSLKATQVISRVREALRLDLSVRVLFEAPTVAELALRVEQSSPKAGELEELARNMAEVEALSEEEIVLELNRA
jgi:hypothetical protein